MTVSEVVYNQLFSLSYNFLTQERINVVSKSLCAFVSLISHAYTHAYIRYSNKLVEVIIYKYINTLLSSNTMHTIAQCQGGH